MLLHSGEKPYQCEQCKKSFAQQSNLKQHMLIHSGEKRHQCMQCNKSFNHKSNLKVHLLVHSGQKLHGCDLCNKSFGSKSYLKHHMLIHSGNKPHQCDHCEKSFTWKSALEKHLRSKHGGEISHQCQEKYWWEHNNVCWVVPLIGSVGLLRKEFKCSGFSRKHWQWARSLETMQHFVSLHQDYRTSYRDLKHPCWL